MDDDRKTEGISSRIKSLAALIASVAALIAALTALWKPTDTEPTRKAYEALASDIRELSKQVNQNHADTMALRDYVNGYVQGRLHRYPATPTSAHHGDAGVGVGGSGDDSGEPPELPPEPSPPPKRVNPEPFDLTQKVLRTPKGD
jgi:hypothetical protein